VLDNATKEKYQFLILLLS